MSRSVQKVGDFDTVASGGFTTLTLDPTGHYYGLNVLCYKDNAGDFVPMSKAEILADIENIQVELGINGRGNKQIVDIRPEGLFPFLDWKDGAKTDYVQAGCIPIPFTRDRLPNILREENALGIGTLNINKFSVSIKYKTNGGFVCNRATLKRDVDEEINVPLGSHPVLLEENREISTTGRKPLRDLPKQIAGSAVLSMHITDGSGAIAEISSCKLGSEVIYEGMDITEHERFCHEGGRNSQYTGEGIWSIDHQRNRGWLDISNTKEHEVFVDWSTAPDSFYIVTDRIDGLNAAA